MLDEERYVDMYRTFAHTLGNLAVEAARSLESSLPEIITVAYLFKIGGTLLRILLAHLYSWNSVSHCSGSYFGRHSHSPER